jgi:anaerobic magnesium-protoporphyrin IX monomethyl ester cyclase
MKILFLNPPFGYNRPEGLDAPLGVMYLGAVLKQAGHACLFVDHAWEKQNDWRKWESALSEKPDIVLINTQIRFSNETHEAVRRIGSRNSQIPVIAFGPQSSTEAPRLLLEMGFDGCVIGEPEEVIPLALKDFHGRLVNADNKIDARPGLATKENFNPGFAPRVDVEKLPFPDWGLVDYGRYIETTHNAVFMASRGLNHEDVFNQPPLIYAASPTRRLSVDRVVRELTELRRRFSGHYMLLFHDELFTEDKKWVIELCSRLRGARLGIPYWCFTRPDLVDLGLCRIMRQSGFVGLSMGMESAADRILKMLGKKITLRQIENGFQAAQQAGLLTAGSVMIGTPGFVPDEPDETQEEIESTARMVDRLHPDVLTVTITTALPGTPLYELVKGRILANSPEEFNFYDLRTGKYPLQLKIQSPEGLTVGIKLIRCAWKRRLWKTVWRVIKLGFLNGPFRNTLCAQVFKVARRKIFTRS